MRVLTYTTLFPNTVQPNHGVFVYQRMAAFAARPGNSVEVIAPIPYCPPGLGGEWKKLRKIPAKEVIGGITVHHPRYPLIPWVSMPVHARLMYSGSVALASRLHRENAFACVDAHYVYPDGKAGLLIGKALGLPTIVSARGSDLNLFPQFRLIRPQIRWTLQEASGRVAVCEALKTEMVNVAGACDVCVIGNGVDLSRFAPVGRKEARRKLGLPLEGRMVVAVGALKPVKGQEFLIRALRQMRGSFPDVHLYLVGEGESRRSLEELAKSLGVEDRVHLTGGFANERLRYWYSAADVSCLASSREGWPNVILESLACGTPVVATQVWGTPEVLSSPDLGVLVEQSTDSLAAGLESAIGREWDAHRLVGYAQKHGWDGIAREVEEYLKGVVEGELKRAAS